MEKYTNLQYSQERALFSTKDAKIEKCVFKDGESPLKESSQLLVKETTFCWKYPLWYCRDVDLYKSKLEETARSGIWYTKNIKVTDCQIDAPKTFRSSEKIRLYSTRMPNAKETLWGCKDIKMFACVVKGDYFGAHSEDIEVENLELYGNYLFDSCKNVTVRNSYLESKDAFWNCENVTLINCVILGEYLGWNTKNLTLINCRIESHQALCYIDGLTMHHCELNNSDLCFEYCHNIDADIVSVVDSIKNPYDGKIVVKDVKELILDKKYIDLAKVKIIKQQ